MEVLANGNRAVGVLAMKLEKLLGYGINTLAGCLRERKYIKFTVLTLQWLYLLSEGSIPQNTCQISKVQIGVACRCRKTTFKHCSVNTCLETLMSYFKSRLVVVGI